MADFFRQFKDMVTGLSLGRKISMGLVLIVALSTVGYLVHASKQASMEPLFTNLTSEDMGTILTQLDKQGIKYQVNQDHRTVLVPSTEVLDIRLKLAGEGLPRFGGVGFEIFDHTGFGMSEFEQRVNYQRALEGELSRTIASIKEVESARVHLVLPEKSLFADVQQPATASVVVKLGNNTALARDKVAAITNLVASSVDSLDPTQVTVVDTMGRLLTQGGGDPSIVAGGQMYDQKMQIERSFEKRIVDLITPIVGFGKIVARVTADMDFTRTESTDEIVDPSKTAVVSESRTTMKKTESGSGSGGVAGADGNLPGGSGGGSGGGASGSADEGSEKISYEVSKSVRKQVSPMGNIKNLSVAILVDGNYVEKDGEMVYAPRPAEEVAKIEELVKKAIGYSQDRGDQIKVENLAFKSPEENMTDEGSWYKEKNTYSFMISVIGNVLVVLVVLLVFFFVIRPLMRNWNQGRGGFMGAGGVPLLNGDVPADVAQLVRTDPIAAANAIRQWLR